MKARLAEIDKVLGEMRNTAKPYVEQKVQAKAQIELRDSISRLEKSTGSFKEQQKVMDQEVKNLQGEFEKAKAATRPGDKLPSDVERSAMRSIRWKRS